MKLKKEKTLSLMEQMELEMMNEEKSKRKEAIDKIAKPFLIKRIWAGLLDIIFIVILTVGFHFCFSELFFGITGYNDCVEEVHQMYEDSYLYQIDANGDYIEYSSKDNLDEIIIKYYSTDEYAISSNELEKYYNDKLESNYFIKDENNNVVLKEGIEQDKLNEFYYSKYQKAIRLFDSNPVYQKLVSKTTALIALTILISITFATSIIYLIIPLLRKEGETPGQIINKLCIIDTRKISTIKKWQIVVRYLIILLFNYFMPIILFAEVGYFVPLTIIISVLMICITKNNLGPHDFATQSMVILKRRSDAFDMLKSINQ